MPELLYGIELLPTKKNDLLATPPQNTLSGTHPVLASSSAPGGTKSVSSSSIQLPVDIEDGQTKQGHIILVIIVLTGVNFLGSLCNGFITIGLPRIASDLSLSEHLILWPSSVY